MSPSAMATRVVRQRHCTWLLAILCVAQFVAEEFANWAAPQREGVWGLQIDQIVVGIPVGVRRRNGREPKRFPTLQVLHRKAFDACLMQALQPQIAKDGAR